MTQLKAWYINLDSPLTRTRFGFDSLDLALDIVLAPDRRSWEYKSYAELLYPMNRFGIAVGMDSEQFDQSRLALRQHFRGETLIPDIEDRIDLLESMRVLLKPRMTQVLAPVGPY